MLPMRHRTTRIRVVGYPFSNLKIQFWLELPIVWIRSCVFYIIVYMVQCAGIAIVNKKLIGARC